MAIYHLHASTGSRQGGQSASAKADYIQREGKYDRGDDEVAHTESGHMPEWAADEPNDYWQAADGIERSAETWFKRYNAKEPEKGGARKSTATKPKEWLENTREAWGERANLALEREGREERIHEGSLEQQYWDAVEAGNEREAERLQDREPGVHQGPVLHMEERGIETERGSLHAEIAEDNALAAQIADYRNEERVLQHDIDRTKAIVTPALPSLGESKVRSGPVKPKMEEEAERQRQQGYGPSR